MSASPTSHGLARRLGTLDAALIGVGSMVGAGVFVAFAPAAAHAGPWLPLALVLAAVVAWCNATSTAQLAARWFGRPDVPADTPGGHVIHARRAAPAR